MISLAYYLRVVAIMWMDRVEVTLPGNPPRTVAPIRGWSPEADPRATPELTAVALLAAAVTILLGIFPSPLFDVVRDVGASLSTLL
jgi:NADH:ubiquinone oxidoreductase subunit 2 (subunit N)